MQQIVFDEPYEFIPPYRRTIWSSLCRWILRGYLRRAEGIVTDEIRGLDRLQASVKAGHGIVLAPNHCRPSDPMAMGLITAEAGIHVYSMASWHVFKQSRLSSFMAHRLGAFSIYREGMDRAALNCAIDLLCEADRPLVIFPEGVISRTNDRLGVLMDGTAFIARSAARKRKKVDSSKQVVIHPVILKYKFQGDIQEAVNSVLNDLETRLSWAPRSHEDPFARIRRVGRALLVLKEVELVGSPQRGTIYSRLERLIDHLLAPLEREWLEEPQAGHVIGRVKRLRSAIIPDMIGNSITNEERERRWKQLADCYLAQQLSLYPPDYVRHDTPPERLLETVERFEEDLNDVARIHPKWKIYMDIGEPIVVPPRAEKTPEGDSVMVALERQMNEQLQALCQELDGAPGGAQPVAEPTLVT